MPRVILPVKQLIQQAVEAGARSPETLASSIASHILQLPPSEAERGEKTRGEGGTTERRRGQESKREREGDRVGEREGGDEGSKGRRDGAVQAGEEWRVHGEERGEGRKLFAFRMERNGEGGGEKGGERAGEMGRENGQEREGAAVRARPGGSLPSHFDSAVRHAVYAAAAAGRLVKTPNGLQWVPTPRKVKGPAQARLPRRTAAPSARDKHECSHYASLLSHQPSRVSIHHTVSTSAARSTGPGPASSATEAAALPASSEASARVFEPLSPRNLNSHPLSLARGEDRDSPSMKVCACGSLAKKNSMSHARQPDRVRAHGAPAKESGTSRARQPPSSVRAPRSSSSRETKLEPRGRTRWIKPASSSSESPSMSEEDENGLRDGNRRVFAARGACSGNRGRRRHELNRDVDGGSGLRCAAFSGTIDSETGTQVSSGLRRGGRNRRPASDDWLNPWHELQRLHGGGAESARPCMFACAPIRGYAECEVADDEDENRRSVPRVRRQGAAVRKRPRHCPMRSMQASGSLTAKDGDGRHDEDHSSGDEPILAPHLRRSLRTVPLLPVSPETADGFIDPSPARATSPCNGEALPGANGSDPNAEWPSSQFIPTAVGRGMTTPMVSRIVTIGESSTHADGETAGGAPEDTPVAVSTTTGVELPMMTSTLTSTLPSRQPESLPAGAAAASHGARPYSSPTHIALQGTPLRSHVTPGSRQWGRPAWLGEANHSLRGDQRHVDPPLASLGGAVQEAASEHDHTDVGFHSITADATKGVAASAGAKDDVMPADSAEEPRHTCRTVGGTSRKGRNRRNGDQSYTNASGPALRIAPTTTVAAGPRRGSRIRRPASDDWVDPWRELARAGKAGARGQAGGL